MSESIKAICSLFIIIALIVFTLSWFVERPNQTTWIVRISALLVAGLSLSLILMLQLRFDIAHDYLQDAVGEYFNRDGFCFAFATEMMDGTCQLQAYYQNQYERPSIGRIALRPASEFSHLRKKIDTITLEIPCEAAGFGVAVLPIAIPREVQGTTLSFDVGASVEYPQGKGQRLRFRDGVFLRTNPEFSSPFGTTLTVLAALGGAVVLFTPARVTIPLPSGAAEKLSASSRSRNHVLWKLGDP